MNRDERHTRGVDQETAQPLPPVQVNEECGRENTHEKYRAQANSPGNQKEDGRHALNASQNESVQISLANAEYGLNAPDQQHHTQHYMEAHEGPPETFVRVHTTSGVDFRYLFG